MSKMNHKWLFIFFTFLMIGVSVSYLFGCSLEYVTSPMQKQIQYLDEQLAEAAQSNNISQNQRNEIKAYLLNATDQLVLSKEMLNTDYKAQSERSIQIAEELLIKYLELNAMRIEGQKQ